MTKQEIKIELEAIAKDQFDDYEQLHRTLALVGLAFLAAHEDGGCEKAPLLNPTVSGPAYVKGKNELG